MTAKPHDGYDEYLDAVGLRLHRYGGPQGNVVPNLMREQTALPFAQKITTQGDLKYSDFDSEARLAISDFAGGMGQLNLAEPNKYAWGKRIDTRSGHLVVGPQWHTSITTALARRLEWSSVPGALEGDNDGWYVWHSINSPNICRACRVVAKGECYERLYLYLQRTAQPELAIGVRIYSDDSGKPANELAFYDLKNTNIPALGGWVEVAFDKPLFLSAWGVYWISVEYGGSSGEVVKWLCTYSQNDGAKGDESTDCAYKTWDEHGNMAWHPWGSGGYTYLYWWQPVSKNELVNGDASIVLRPDGRIRDFSHFTTQNIVYGFPAADATDPGISDAHNRREVAGVWLDADLLPRVAPGWMINEWIGYRVKITSGNGVDQDRLIISNTATQLNVSEDWETIPLPAGSVDPTFRIYHTEYAPAEDWFWAQSGARLWRYRNNAWTQIGPPLIDVTLEGVAAGVSSTLTLKQAPDPGWTVDAYKDMWLIIQSDSMKGQWRRIVSNTSDTLTIETGWTAVGAVTFPEVTTEFIVGPPASVRALCTFNIPGDVSHLYMALGPTAEILDWDGSLSDLYWQKTEPTKCATCLCTHDSMLWLAYDNLIYAWDGSDWSLTGEVGSAERPIKQIFSWQGKLFAAKIDGLYEVTYPDTASPGGFPSTGEPKVNKVLDFWTKLDDNNWNDYTIFQNDLYFPISHGLMRWSASGVLTRVNPDASLEERSDDRGYYRALCSDDAMLYAALNYGPAKRGAVLAFDKSGWCPLLTPPRRAEDLAALYLDPSGGGKLWVGAMLQPCFANIPAWTTRRYLTGGVDYESSGEIQLSWWDANLHDVEKTLYDVRVIVSDDTHIDSTHGVVGWYRTDIDSAPWVQMTATRERNAMRFTFGVDPVTSVPIFPVCRRVQFRFLLMAGANVNSPQVVAVVVAYNVQPERPWRYRRDYVLGDRLELGEGLTEPRTLDKQLEDIRELCAKRAPCHWTDFLGRQRWVQILGASVSVVELVGDKPVDRTCRMIISLDLQEVEL